VGRCTAKTARGKRCKRAAVKGSDPALCVSHVGGKVGRKTGLTDEIADRLVQLLQAGNYLETALAAAGVARSTFYDWMDRGDPDGTAAADEPFRAFRERVDHARAEGEARNVALVARAAATDWKAAAWMLERQFPERWSRTQQRPADTPPPAAPTSSPDAFDELDARRSKRAARGS
jgi:transposase